MTPLDDATLLHELAPVVARNVERHLATAKEWLPHEWLPWSRGRDFGGDTPPVTAVKGATGHLIAGSGAVEAIVTLRSLDAGIVPPIAGLHHVDPNIRVDLVQHAPRKVHRGPALSNSFGFGGINTALVLSAA